MQIEKPVDYLEPAFNRLFSEAEALQDRLMHAEYKACVAEVQSQRWEHMFRWAAVSGAVGWITALALAILLEVKRG